MVTGSGDAVTVAKRMITGLEKQAGLLRGVRLGTGNWQGRTTQAVETVVGQLGKAARGQERALRSVAQMLERRAETLRMMAWGKQTGPQKSMNSTTPPTQIEEQAENKTIRLRGGRMLEDRAWTGTRHTALGLRMKIN